MQLAKVPGAGRDITVIPALPDDSMGYVLTRLQEAKQTGVIAMIQDGQVLCSAILFRASPARVEVAEEDDVVMKVHDDSTVDFFFHVLKETGRDVVVSRVAARLVAPECCDA
jgi:hypothetical protein